ncbi:Os09g0514350 [Oryza sativa Japonica Group]|uniref:Os09g0514350 protein n=1 Tax=Oryza sativa subsp. japonica TaxID=39947 RepID=A0A0P0XQG4_ORYSJ|nr:hypothetical protein EE612_048914 [Oryza sativa]BAT08944.1 Os09g0514350 [Oryza sativa Japonica Group]
MHGFLIVFLIALKRFHGKYCLHLGYCNHPESHLHRTLVLHLMMCPPHPPESLTEQCEAPPIPRHRNGYLEAIAAEME